MNRLRFSALVKDQIAVRIYELPALDASRCNGSGDCVLICPASCLEMAGSLPWLPRPLDCISCGLCVEVCPTDALMMRALEAADSLTS